jgi:hypothetical protein
MSAITMERTIEVRLSLLLRDSGDLDLAVVALGEVVDHGTGAHRGEGSVAGLRTIFQLLD